MARLLYGGTGDTAQDKAGNWMPNAVLEVRDSATKASLTDLAPPAEYDGLPFPAGKARADTNGYVAFQGPDGFTGDVDYRAVNAVGQAGPWVRLWDVASAVDAGIDRAEAEGRLLTPEVANSTYAPILDDGRGVVRRGDLVVNVRDYGAVGDGVADDGPEIQAAVDACAAAGGGTVFLPRGTYRLATVTGANNVLLTPKSGVSIRGEGDTSVLKVADGMNATGYNVIYPPSSTSADRVDNAQFRDFMIDENGANNIPPAGQESSRKNAAIGVRYGSYVLIENVTVRDNPGRQTFQLGNTPSDSRHMYVRNCRVYNVGAGVAGNGGQNDHSVVYIACSDFEVSGNEFRNEGGLGAGTTGIEVHSSVGQVHSNRIASFSTGFNVCAIVGDHIGVRYYGNVVRDTEQGVVVWTSGTWVMRDTAITDNTFEQTSAVGHIINASGSTTVAVAQLEICRNILRSTLPPSAFTGSGISLGKINHLVLRGNHIEGTHSRAVQIGVNDITDGRWVIEDNLAIDCGRTTSASTSHHHGYSFNATSTLASLRFIRNRAVNTGGGTSLTKLASGNMGISLLEAWGNSAAGVADPTIGLTGTVTAKQAMVADDLAVGGKFAANGATPVGKAANPGTATGTDAAVINAVVTALRNAGIVA